MRRSRRGHHRVDDVRIINKGQLLRRERFLARASCGLVADSGGRRRHPTHRITAVHSAADLLAGRSLRMVLARELLRLHHVRLHAERLLMVRSRHSAEALYLVVSDVARGLCQANSLCVGVRRLDALLRARNQHVLRVDGLLATDHGAVTTERVQHFTESLVKASRRLR